MASTNKKIRIASFTALVVIITFSILFSSVIGLYGEDSKKNPELDAGKVADNEKIKEEKESHKSHKKLSIDLFKDIEETKMESLKAYDSAGTQLVIETSNKDAVKKVLKDNDIKIESEFDDLIQVNTALDNVSVLESIGSVEYVRYPAEARPFVVSEGASVMGTDAWNLQGYSGEGVKVAILDLGFMGYSSLLGTELPSSVVTMSFRADGNLEAHNHGTACAEVAYDIAPDAELYLVNFGTEVELLNAVAWLASEGVDIISASWGFDYWYGSYGDGQGPICDIVNYAESNGILWVNAAGNAAINHWEGDWVDADNDGLLDFKSSAEPYVTFSYDPSWGPVFIDLIWDDYKYSGQHNDYDLLLVDGDGNTIAFSAADQTIGAPPIEIINYWPSSPGYYYVYVYKSDSSRDCNFDMLIETYSIIDPYVSSGSIMIPADAESAFAVGATFWANDALEIISSQGPTNSGLMKPNVCGPDGVSTVTFPMPFLGTSAAAPQVAGFAACLLSSDPGLSVNKIRHLIESHAVDLAAPGRDNMTGYGRVNSWALPPVLISPEDGSTVDSFTPTFTWNTVDGATEYQIQVSKKPDFKKKLVICENVDTNTYTAIKKLPPHKKYYWRVKAKDANGEWGPWSDVWSFSTPKPGDIGTPILVSPEEGSTVEDLRPTFTWEPVEGADKYEIEISKKDDFHKKGIKETVSSTSYTVESDLLPDTTYYWKVKVNNSHGNNWSEVWSFTTPESQDTDDLEAPILISPENDSTVEDLLPTFTWDEVDDATEYEIQVSKRADFKKKLVISEDIDTNTYTLLEELSRHERYYWRVKAKDSGGEWGPWSEVWSFTTPEHQDNDESEAPVLVSPEDGSTVEDLLPTFTWDPVDGANEYEIEISKKDDFHKKGIKETVSSTSYTVESDLAPGTTYYWKVKVKDGHGNKWSEVWSFSTP